MSRSRALQLRIRNVVRRVGVELVPNRPHASLMGLHLNRLFDVHRIDCVLDVGARDGEYGRWLRDNGYRGRIVSFEPVDTAQLEAAAHDDGSWQVVRTALGAQDGEASINVAKMRHLTSFHTSSEGAAFLGDRATLQRIETVPVRTLNTVWDEHVPAGARVYLKMDTQGFDLEVLAGLGDRRVEALQTEIAVQPIYEGSPQMLDHLAAVGAAGFIISGMFPVNFDERLALVEFDCVAVRAG